MTAVLPAGESKFAGQPTQPEETVPDLYVPPEHSVHGPPLGPVDPALHTHAVIVVPAVGELESAGQFEHEFKFKY